MRPTAGGECAGGDSDAVERPTKLARVREAFVRPTAMAAGGARAPGDAEAITWTAAVTSTAVRPERASGESVSSPP